MKLLQFLFNHHQKPTTMKQFRILAAIVLLLAGVSADTLAQDIRPTIQKEVRLVSPATGETGYVGLRSTAGTVSYTLSMPATLPTANQILSVSSITGGSVSLTWSNPAAASWSLAGNSISSTSFLGSTNDQALLFKTNNEDRLTIAGGGAGTAGGAVTINNLGGSAAGTVSSTNTSEGVVIASATGLLMKASYNDVVSAGLSANTSGLTIGGPLTVQGLITGNNGATLSGTTSITGNTSINTTGTGSTSIGNASSTIATAGTLSHTGNLTVSGTSNLTGATTLGNTLQVTGATTLSSTLDVTGATTLNNTLTVAGATTLSSTTINGPLTANNGATISGTLTVNGPLAAGTSSPTTGLAGYVLQSNGASAAPTWSSAYIKGRGFINNISNAENTSAIAVSGLTANDAINVTLESTSTSAEIPSFYVIRNVSAGNFTVYFSAAYTGRLNWTVINND
jgi:hypothetical protein